MARLLTHKEMILGYQVVGVLLVREEESEAIPQNHRRLELVESLGKEESGIRPPKFTVEREDGELTEWMGVSQFFSDIKASSTFLPLFFRMPCCQQWKNRNYQNRIVRKLPGLKNTPLHKHNQVVMQDPRGKKVQPFPKV